MAEDAQAAFVFAFHSVGRVEKNKIEGLLGPFGEFLQGRAGIGRNQFYSALNFERSKIFPNKFYGRNVIFYEDGFFGTATECFDANSAGSRIQIKKTRTVDGITEYIEQCFAQVVAGWAEFQAFEAFQDAAAELTSN